MRLALALAALLLLATFAPPRLYAPRRPPEISTLHFQPVALNPGQPGRREIGGLVYLGGWSITSNDPRFGGLSALHVEGRDLLALSDTGAVAAFSLPGKDGTKPLRIRLLPDGPGSGERKADRDTEAMVVGPDDVWIAFETRNAAWRYSRTSWQAKSGSAPAAMRSWGKNAGGEAMVRLADGRFLVFAEGGHSGGTTPVLLFAGDPAEAGVTSIPLRYQPPAGHRITDAALLPDGRLLFLNRRIGWLGDFTARLTIGALPRLEAGAVLGGREVADFSPPILADNMEALSVAREGGRTIVWIASDDNFSPMQRTLLLKFALAG